MKNIIFIHGLESSGKGFKGLYLKKIIPEILTPDFAKFNQKISLDNLFNARMTQLNSILRERNLWIIIGSSFGGLMGVLYTLQNPEKIKRMISTYFTKLKGTKVKLKGKDLKDMGFQPGLLYKEIFNSLMEARLNNFVSTKKDEIRFFTLTTDW